MNINQLYCEIKITYMELKMDFKKATNKSWSLIHGWVSKNQKMVIGLFLSLVLTTIIYMRQIYVRKME